MKNLINEHSSADVIEIIVILSAIWYIRRCCKECGISVVVCRIGRVESERVSAGRAAKDGKKQEDEEQPDGCTLHNQAIRT